jgi:hypothetical protein
MGWREGFEWRRRLFTCAIIADRRTAHRAREPGRSRAEKGFANKEMAAAAESMRKAAART